MSYKLTEVFPTHSRMPGLTFIVTHADEVLFCKCYTRHREVLYASLFEANAIAWGGIMDTQGFWTRRSLDFGDAPTLSEREEVVNLLKKAYK